MCILTAYYYSCSYMFFKIPNYPSLNYNNKKNYMKIQKFKFYYFNDILVILLCIQYKKKTHFFLFNLKIINRLCKKNLILL